MILLLALAALLLAPQAPRAQDRTTLHVFAAASLLDAFDAIAKDFEKHNENVKVRIQYGGSQALAAQIEQGAQADVFASADERWMAEVARKGFVDGTPRTFAGNRLVFVVPRTNPGRVHRVADAARAGVRVLVGSDQVPVGAYTRLALSKLSADPAYGQDFARRVQRNVVSQEDNVKSIVNKLALGEADAGFVYRSDVENGAAPPVTAIELPASARVVARYPIAALESPRAALAARFVAYVLSPAGQATLRKANFSPAP